MGIGLKSLTDIEPSQLVVQMSTKMGLLSGLDQKDQSTPQGDIDAEFYQQMKNHTRLIAEKMSPAGNRAVANRFYHHLMLTQ